jgi:hypothetical protein
MDKVCCSLKLALLLIWLTNAHSSRDIRYRRYHGIDDTPCDTVVAAKDFCSIVGEYIAQGPTKKKPKASATYHATRNGATAGSCVTLDLTLHLEKVIQ